MQLVGQSVVVEGTEWYTRKVLVVGYLRTTALLPYLGRRSIATPESRGSAASVIYARP